MKDSTLQATSTPEWVTVTKAVELLTLEGRAKHRKIIGASYNEKLSRRSSKAIRNNIGERKASIDRAVFSDVFPDVRL